MTADDGSGRRRVYTPTPGAYDEMYDELGQPRPGVVHLDAALQDLGSTGLHDRGRVRDSHLTAQGITFTLALLNFVGLFALYQRRIRRASEQHDLLDEVIHKVAACVMVLDEDGVTVIKNNHTAERLFGRDPGALIGMRFDELVMQVRAMRWACGRMAARFRWQPSATPPFCMAGACSSRRCTT